MQKIKVLGVILSFAMVFALPVIASNSDLPLEVRDGIVICDCGVTYQEHIERVKELDEAEFEVIDCQCGAVMSLSTVGYGDWYRTTTSRECVHTAYGHDYQWERISIVGYNCSSCALYLESPCYSHEWVCGELE